MSKRKATLEDWFSKPRAEKRFIADKGACAQVPFFEEGPSGGKS